jgi:hypothetical protein
MRTILYHHYRITIYYKYLLLVFMNEDMKLRAKKQ